MFRSCWLLSLMLLSGVVFGQQSIEVLVDKLEGFKFKNWDSVEYYSNEILEASREGQHREIGLALQYLGVVQYEKYGDYDSALSLYNVAVGHFRKDKDSTLLAAIYNNYGVVHKTKANYDKALDYFFKALDFISSDSTSSISITLLNNIGEVSFYMGKVDESEKYHQLAYESALFKNDSLLLGASLVYLGNIASSKMESEKAIDYYSNALKYLSQYNANTANIIMNIGIVYHFKGELREAISYYQKAITVAKEFKSSQSLALSYLNMGEAMLTLDDPNTVKTLRKTVEIASEFNLNRILRNAHQFLASYYENHNNYKLALEHFKYYKNFSDSIINENSLARFNSLNVKFNTAQKEKQIADQELQIEQKNASIIKQRNQKIFIAIVLIFILLIGALFYLRSRMKQKYLLQQAVITEKEKGLKAIFMATENERQRISKDLHDGVGQHLSSVKMQLESLTIRDERINVKKQHIIKNLGEAAQEIRQISHKMMPRSLEEVGLVPSLEDLFSKTFTQTSIKCSFEYNNVEQRYPKDVEISLYRIVQELLNNIIKHSHANNVAVQLYTINKKLIMTVEDDGIGFDVKVKSSGHGLLNIKSRIETLNGNFECESVENTQTVITLSVPLT